LPRDLALARVAPMLAAAPLLIIAPSAANAQEPAAPAEIVVT
jgi:hypothetical protein